MTFTPDMLAALSPSPPLEDVLLIDGAFYDTHKLAAIHPGGPLAVCMSNQRDATALFRSAHRRSFPHRRYATMRVPAERVAPSIRASIRPNHQSFAAYDELCVRVSSHLAGSRGFAPQAYYAKVALWVGLALTLDVLGVVTGLSLTACALHGLVLAFIGLNVQHDANHGAVSMNPQVNRLLGLTQDYIGGSSLAWQYYHNVIHHVHCNDPMLDADLAIPMLRLKRTTPQRFYYAMQHLYVVALELTFGIVHLATTVWDSIVHTPTAPSLPSSYRWAGYVGTLLALVRVVAPFLHHTPATAALHVATLYGIGGAYLAFFFLLSHNYVGVDKGRDSTVGCFLTQQVETSSNVGGWWLAWANGGLNYQIEHHLFPRVHHSHYPAIAGVVRRFCEERGIKYHHFGSVGRNLWSTVRHLWRMGHSEDGK